MPNVKEIKKRMIDTDITYADIAKAIGKSTVSVRQKIYGHRPLFLYEAEIIQRLLHIEDQDFCKYFFNNKSHNVTEND